MAHKVRVDVSFADLEQYQLMKSQLDGVNLKLDTFVNYCVDLVWNQMLEEHKKQLASSKEDAELEQEILKELADEATGHESSGDTEQVPEPESLDTKESLHG